MKKVINGRLLKGELLSTVMVSSEGKGTMMLAEALRAKLFAGSTDGSQGMDTAVPRGLLAQSMRNILRRVQMAPPGAVPEQNFLGGVDLNMNGSQGCPPNQGYKILCSSLVGLTLCLLGLG